MAQIFSIRQKQNNHISRNEDRALEDRMTHWMHVDWMTAVTSRVTSHYLLQLRYYSATVFEDKDCENTDMALYRGKSVERW